jgi:hypothetical protein
MIEISSVLCKIGLYHPRMSSFIVRICIVQSFIVDN